MNIIYDGARGSTRCLNPHCKAQPYSLMVAKSKIYKWPGRNVTKEAVVSSTIGWRGCMTPPYNQNKMPSEGTHHKGSLFLQVHQQDPTLLSQAPGAGYSLHGCEGGPGMPCLKEAACTFGAGPGTRIWAWCSQNFSFFNRSGKSSFMWHIKQSN